MITEIIKEQIQRLSDIENANPSEALECLKKLESKSQIIQGCYEFNISKKEELENNEEVDKYINIIKQALIKEQKQEKVLKIVFKKQVDINEIKILLVSLTYCDDVERCKRYNSSRKVGYKLKQDEFDLLKRCFSENE